jgi:hypothetical protein
MVAPYQASVTAMVGHGNGGTLKIQLGGSVHGSAVTLWTTSADSGARSPTLSGTFFFAENGCPDVPIYRHHICHLVHSNIGLFNWLSIRKACDVIRNSLVAIFIIVLQILVPNKHKVYIQTFVVSMSAKEYFSSKTCLKRFLYHKHAKHDFISNLSLHSMPVRSVLLKFYCFLVINACKPNITAFAFCENWL